MEPDGPSRLVRGDGVFALLARLTRIFIPETYMDVNKQYSC